jgi:hypothetical protein
MVALGRLERIYCRLVDRQSTFCTDGSDYTNDDDMIHVAGALRRG